MSGSVVFEQSARLEVKSHTRTRSHTYGKRTFRTGEHSAPPLVASNPLHSHSLKNHAPKVERLTNTKLPPPTQPNPTSHPTMRVRQPTVVLLAAVLMATLAPLPLCLASTFITQVLTHPGKCGGNRFVCMLHKL